MKTAAVNVLAMFLFGLLSALIARVLGAEDLLPASLMAMLGFLGFEVGLLMDVRNREIDR